MFSSILDVIESVIARFIFLLIIFAAFVVPLELLLAKAIPEGRVKAFLFDRTLQKRRPFLWTAIWAALMGLIGFVIYFRLS